jgi:hypothetical protein
MNIKFDIGTSSAQFHRNPLTGSTCLLIDGQKTSLASPLDPATQFSMQLKRVWTVSHGARTIEIEKIRPQWLAGFRPQTYVVRVDGEEVATAHGF